MTTKYTVKKCNSFGFAQSFDDALHLFKNLDASHFIYLHDSSKESTPPSVPCKDYTSIDDIIIPGDKRATIFVELGYKKEKTIPVPVEYDDTEIVKEFKHEYGNDNFKDYILNLTEEDERSAQLSNEFISFVVDLYPHLHDYVLKDYILKLLNKNGYKTIDLEKQYPFEYEDELATVIENAEIFSDIEVSVDKNDKNTSTSLYRADQDALKKATLGKTTQLDAFSENKFTVIHTKKKCGIENRIRNQNHDVLDTLAVNGVMKFPKTNKPLSVYKLMVLLEKFEKFDIVFIHPSYEVRYMNAEYPCEQIIPAYRINEGEILAIVYRYIAMYFFGYCSIITDSMLEWRYYI